MPKKKMNKAWVVTVDMGYGHQRASYPLKRMAEGGIITANTYPGIPESDKSLWVNSKAFYEFISRFKRVPLIGQKAFDLYDKFQAIPNFYPKRDLSKANIQLKEIYHLFEKSNYGRHLIEKLAKKPLPFVTTFFVTAFMAEYFNYPGEIYCVICDADISRTWAPLNPKTSRIIYLASNIRVVERLKLYGIRAQNIYLTGFPLPEENTGKNLSLLKKDLGERLVNLDPKRVYIEQYHDSIREQLGAKNVKVKNKRPITLTFCVGGAGAQREQGMVIVSSLKKELADSKIRLNLVAGSNKDVYKYFKQEIKKLKLDRKANEAISIVFDPIKMNYFKKFNLVLRKTDILWTKPSELSFYCALGLPIIMAQHIGSQEIFNQQWLRAIGAGIEQEDPAYVNEWLFDWIDSGWLAEAAMQGFIESPKYGTYNVEKVIFHHAEKTKTVKTVLQY